MSDPLVVTLVRQYKAGLLAREDAVMRDMAAHWLRVVQSVQADIDALVAERAMREAAGETLSRAALYRMERYQRLKAQAAAELRRYVDYADGLITREQLNALGLGVRHAAEAIQAGYAEAGMVVNFGLLDPSAVEYMAGAASNGTPLRKLLAASYSDAIEGLVDALVGGVARGQAPRRVAAELVKAAAERGFNMGLQRAMTIARTEVLGAYRRATLEGYRESGVVRGYRRTAAHDGRVCLGCLALDGKLYRLDTDVYDHPNGRCSAVPVLAGIRNPPQQTGLQWFKELDWTAQREIMGNARYDAWKAGQFKFRDLATITESDEWGPGVAVTPLGKLLN